MKKPERPCLRYYGGKWILAPWVISYFPEHSHYIEPFSGAASVLLRKDPVKFELINDIWDEIVNFFRVLRDQETAEQLKNLIVNTPFSRTEFNNAYNKTDIPVESARRLVIRSFMGFGGNGIFRESSGFRSRDRSNRPSVYDWSGYPDQIEAFTKRLKNVVIENRDAFELIQKHDNEGVLFYLDPPYVHKTMRDNRHKYVKELDDTEHLKLSELIHDLKGMVVLSGYPSELYDKIYKDWTCIKRIHTGHKAKKCIECLWISPNTPIQQPEFDYKEGRN